MAEMKLTEVMKLRKAKRIAAAAREDAQQRGERQFSGISCKHGHPPIRYTSTGVCVRCQQLKDAAGGRRTAPGRRVIVHPPYTAEQEALLSIGAPKFYGRQCDKGHDGLRYARTSRCYHCQAAMNGAVRGMTKRERREHRLEQQRARDRAAWELVAHAKKVAPKEIVPQRHPAINDILLALAICV